MAQRKHRSKRTKPGANEGEKRHIPIDIYEEILFRLPAVHLLNCKCVCKDWLRLISSPGFIHKHLMYRSNAGRNETRILMPLSSDQIIDYNYDASGGNNNISNKIPYPPGFSGAENTMILGSCDGLICLLDEGSRKLAVYNPSTRNSDIRIVEELVSNMSTCCYWFGHHPSTGEYVLVIGRMDFSGPSGHTIEVYKFSCKLKSVLSCPIPGRFFCFREIGTLLHGNLHWSAAEVPFVDNPGIGLMVLAYDFQENKILEISPPPTRKSCFTLGVVDGCLCAIFSAGETLELWTLKEYGVDESWTNYGNIEGCGNSCSLLSPVGFLRNGDLILDADRSKLMKYSFGDKKAMLLEGHKSCLHCGAFVCVDSLVSPALIWGE